MNEDTRSELSITLQATAWWRRQKAEEFPTDGRNAEAAELLDRIAGTVDEVPDDLWREYESAAEDDYVLTRTMECQSEQLREIGFHSEYQSATKLIESIVDKIRELKADVEADRLADLRVG